MTGDSPKATRPELREALLDAAEAAILAEGFQALRARSLTRAAGCALGALYTVFPDMDAVVLGVKARILDRLDARLLATLAETRPADRESGLAALVAMARTYLDFAWDDRRRWEVLFQHHLAGGVDHPDWYRARLGEIFSHIDVPVRAAWPAMDPQASQRLARTLFSAVHGIVVMAVERKLATPARDEVLAEIEGLLRAAVAGWQVGVVAARKR